MSKLLYKLQAGLNKMAEHPGSLALCVVFLIGWTAASLASNGKFDSGLGIENLIINGLSILLLFAANSKHTSYIDASAKHNQALHEKLDALTALRTTKED